MRRTPSRLRRRALAIGFLAAAVPLAVMLALQWVWLGRLEETSRIAQRSALYLVAESIVGEVESFYRAAAERALEHTPDEPLRTAFARQWSRGPVEGVRTLFLVDYGEEWFGNVLRWDPEQGQLVTPPASEEALAIIVACTPWQMASYHRRVVGARGFMVDERDPAHRIVALPLLDAESHIVGVAGMILDEDYLLQTLLPRALEGARSERLAVRVRDAERRDILAVGGPEGKSVAERRFPWAFADWTLAVSGGDGAEHWARAGFAFNMTLAVLLAATLLGGLLFALRAAVRAVELSEMKSDFVSNVSHELRTPLASIRTFGELLKLGRASPERIQGYGAHIEAESRRLSRLIDNLLDFSRIESGRKAYRLVEGRIEDVVASAIEAFEVRTREAGFEIRYLAPANPLPTLWMDPDAISQAVHNLLENAVKYSGESRRIEVGLDVEDGFVVCAVRDWGIGIPPDEQRRIFDRFHRVGSALVHDVKGTGLGLAIVQHVVRAHRGDVRVESVPGHGTTVSLRLPVGPPPPSAPESGGG